jgi:sugar lactone lactonase YvrE
MPQHALTTIFDGGRYLESPRWRQDRLWLVDCLPKTLLSLGPSGAPEQHAVFDNDTPCGLGFLPDGRLVVLTMHRRQLLAYDSGQIAAYADLSGVARGAIDDMIVDGLGRAYVGDLGFPLPPPPERGADGRIILVLPDGRTRVVAEGLRFPNGIAVSSKNDRLVVAEMEGDCLADYAIEPDGSLSLRRRIGEISAPDGICLDCEGAVWVAAFNGDAFLRIDQDGRERDRISVPGRRAIACVLGGHERRTLYCLSADTSYARLAKGDSSARIDIAEVAVPGDGYP